MQSKFTALKFLSLFMPPSLKSLASSDLFYCLYSLSLPESHLDGIIQHKIISDGLLSINNTNLFHLHFGGFDS